MCKLVFSLTYLACAVIPFTAGKLDENQRNPQSIVDHRRSSSLKSLARLLYGSSPVAGWQASGGAHGHIFGKSNVQLTRQPFSRHRKLSMQEEAKNAPKMLVLGGTGYLGSRVCQEAVKFGFEVVGVSRRGVNPMPKDRLMKEVKWGSVDLTDASAVQQLVDRVDPDVVVHAVSLLFDVDSGLKDFNKIVSGSGSIPGETSTYDRITRLTAENALNAFRSLAKNPLKNNFGRREQTFVFTSCAEAGWPDVTFGDAVENVAPEWLKRYLVAKRSVEDMLTSQTDVRELRYRPSLIWSWDKLDVLPLIPVFNIAAALGVPFVDKTVKVNDLAKAILWGAVRDGEDGIKRAEDIERFAREAEEYFEPEDANPTGTLIFEKFLEGSRLGFTIAGVYFLTKVYFLLNGGEQNPDAFLGLFR